MTNRDLFDLGVRIGAAEEQARAARERLSRLTEQARSGAAVIGTYDARRAVDAAEAVVAKLRAMVPDTIERHPDHDALSPAVLRQAMGAVIPGMLSDDYPGNPDYIDTATIEQIAAALRALVTGETA